MSKLIEKLKKLSQTAPPPMGFHTNRPVEENPALLAIGRLQLNSTAPATKYNGGADAVLIYSNKTELTLKEIQKTVKSLGDIPWGVYLEESGSETAALIEAGCDFIVFSPASRITDLPQDENTGKILQLESSMDDGLLRAVNDLPADAVLVTDALAENEILTIHHLMIYRHVANYIGKPLITPVPANIAEADLKALRDAEIKGVMAEIDTTNGEDLKELKKKIVKLPPRIVKKQEKGGVIIPHIATAAAPPDEEEEEE
jgi:hypothetical protein